MNLESIIGLEVHVQLSTKSKLFCHCDNDAFGVEPNTHTCPICMGFPGTLPMLNQSALEKAMTGAMALGGEIQLFSKFDRKNYFYPDLPAGYQISQFDKPLSLGGAIKIQINNKEKIIRIHRLHLENDAGKLTHEKSGTYLDYNRSGTPLVEIVTEPDIRSGEEAQLFAKEIQKIFRSAESSNADMEKGMMRFDASISLREVGSEKLNPRTEIKNLNSFRSLQRALEYQICEQKKLWEKNQIPQYETTVGWVDDEERTQLLRKKESSTDYRYFPEPDIPPVVIQVEEVEKIREKIGELPSDKMKRYQKEWGMSEEAALKLTQSKQLIDFFEHTVDLSKDPKQSANMILSVILANKTWENSHITPQIVADTIALLKASEVSSSGAKQIITEGMKQKNTNAKTLLSTLGLAQVSDSGELQKWTSQVIDENQEALEDYDKNPEKIVKFLTGQVMKLSRGSANPAKVQKCIQEKLEK